VVKATDTETSGFGSAEALCNAGDIATGGGALLSDSIDDAQYLGDTQTEKLDGRQGWLGSWLNRSGGNATQTMTVKAICQHTE
jgi:hypothetical protein